MISIDTVAFWSIVICAMFLIVLIALIFLTLYLNREASYIDFMDSRLRRLEENEKRDAANTPKVPLSPHWERKIR